MSEKETERLIKAIISLKEKMTESQRFEVIKAIYYALDIEGFMDFILQCEFEER